MNTTSRRTKSACGTGTGWRARSIRSRREQLNTGDFLFAEPGFFEVCLLPQVYNARRFGFDFTDKPHTTRIEQACLALPPFQRAHPDNQPDNPERKQEL